MSPWNSHFHYISHKIQTTWSWWLLTVKLKISIWTNHHWQLVYLTRNGAVNDNSSCMPHESSNWTDSCKLQYSLSVPPFCIRTRNYCGDFDNLRPQAHYYMIHLITLLLMYWGIWMYIGITGAEVLPVVQSIDMEGRLRQRNNPWYAWNVIK